MAVRKSKAGNEWRVSKAKANFATFLRAAEDTPQVVISRDGAKFEICLLPTWKKAVLTTTEKRKHAGR